MLRQNVCKFISFQSAPDVINTINFVYETEKQIYSKLNTDAVYKIYCVQNGAGALHIRNNTFPLGAGDVFFTFPSVEYAIESVNDFKYYYITFLGIRAGMLMERVGINRNNFLFKNCPEALKTWSSYFNISNQSNIDMISESAFLYTLSVIGSQISDENTEETLQNAVLTIKAFIDKNIQNHRLGIDLISKECSYNKNYISNVFKKAMDLTVSQYINITRIQTACSLMQRKITCIKDIAYMCGFNDALYFSKVFKKQTGVTPREFIVRINAQKD